MESSSTATLVASSALVSAISYYTSMIIWKKFSERRLKHFKSLNEQDQLEWSGRSPSTLHAVVLITACIYLFLFTDTFSETIPSKIPFVLKHSTVSTATLGFSTGYFIMDIVMLVLYYPCFGTGPMALHHIAALASVGTSGLLGQGHAYTLLLLSTEVTTPLVNARWFLDKAGMKDHPLYLINGISMMLSWLLARVLFLALYIFPLIFRHKSEIHLLNWETKLLLETVPALLLVLNVFWFSKILKGAINLLLKDKNTAKTD